MSNFISLHNQTQFSLLDSLCSVKGLLDKAKELGQTSLAITDHGTLTATWDAFKYANKIGIKLLIGCECYFTADVANIESKIRHVIFIAKNATGYRNLLKLNKKASDQGKIAGSKVYPIVDWKLLEQHIEGLICLTACGNGIIAQSLSRGDRDKAEEDLLRLKSLFGENLGIEILANNMKRHATTYSHEIDQQYLNKQLIKLGEKHSIKVVAACNTHYISKEDYKTHDVLLAIGAKQPVFSNFRLKYPVNDFYLKTEIEMLTFFSRNYTSDQAKEFVYNSKLFADMCEEPEWIDPKFSNPSGKELPVFPVQDTANYSHFVKWKAKLPVSDTIHAISEDKAYMRYLCAKAFNKITVPEGMREVYVKRIEKELDVLEELDLSSYMLITADFLNFARESGISVGPGRGCLSDDTKVLTINGFKELKDLEIGESVYSHTGVKQIILNRFEYDIDEECLEIKSQNSFGNLRLTKDHKIFASYNKKTRYTKTYSYTYNKNHKYKGTKNSFSEPQWIEASSLNIGDYIYTTFPNRNNEKYKYVFDLVKFTKNKYQYNENEVFIKKNLSHNLSIRQIQKNTSLGFTLLRSYKDGRNNTNLNKHILEQYLAKNETSLEKWQKIPKCITYPINRFIEIDDDLLYILGRWVGDGSFKHKGFGINIAFHKKETNAIERISKYFTKIGFNVYKNVSKVSDSISLDIGNKILFNLFKHIFNLYKGSSKTKTLPFFFRKLNDDQLLSVMKGVIDSDGHVNASYERINTISKTLAAELKECLNYLHIASAVYYNKANNNGGRNNSASYTLNFSGIYRDKVTQHYHNNGYFSKITNINTVKLKKVYDISVDNDASYLTSSGVVHNSAGGSYIAFLLNIHCADSIKYGLLFERFHNKLKTAMSDIDNDIAGSGRARVIEYISNKYGEDYVALISNHNTITPKIYIKDISRALEFGGGREEAVQVGNAIASCVGADIKSISQAYNKVPLFGEFCKQYPALLNHQEISGQMRNFSTHAGGIVICERPITGLVPLRRDKEGSLILEYEKYNAEDNGLVKIDILGLKTLDVIDLIKDLISKNGKHCEVIDTESYDEGTYNLISKGDCDFVFQFGGSGGTIDLCKRVKPKNIEDLAVITTLARPGCKEIRDDFIKTRDGKMDVAMYHPKLANALTDTLGFALYDESLLMLANDVAGWDLAQADGLRKLTKLKGSKPELAANLQSSFIEDSINNGVDKHNAQHIWTKIVEPFGLYSFNKSHAILYSMISYQTAYLKAHFPIEFLLGNLMTEVKSNAPTAKANVKKAKNALRLHKIKIVPPDINSSELAYTMVDDKTLMTGLDALKSVGDDAILDVLEKRPFTSFQDFMARVSSKTVRANTIQAFAAAGALDAFCNKTIRRKDLFLYCSDYRKKLTAWKKTHDYATEEFHYPWVEEDDWTLEERYALEVHFLNEGFACKPHKAYGDFFEGDSFSIKKIKRAKNKAKVGPVKGIVVDFFSFQVKKENSKFYGQPMAKIMIEDKAGERISCTAFPEGWQTLLNRLKDLGVPEFDVGLALSFGGSANMYEDDMGVILNELFEVKKAPAIPADRKARKVSSRTKTAKAEDEKSIIDTPITDPKLIDQLENFLYEEGVLDLHD